MSVKGVGVDLVEISRIAQALRRKSFPKTIYTSHELEALAGKGPQSWAARFAAKEAVMKALGRGFRQGVPFAEVEIYTNDRGQPQVRLLGSALAVAESLGVTEFHVSLSHSKELAIAYVIATGEE